MSSSSKEAGASGEASVAACELHRLLPVALHPQAMASTNDEKSRQQQPNNKSADKKSLIREYAEKFGEERHNISVAVTTWGLKFLNQINMEVPFRLRSSGATHLHTQPLRSCPSPKRSLLPDAGQKELS